MLTNENSALLNELINVEELEQKTAPSGTWDPVPPRGKSLKFEFEI